MSCERHLGGEPAGCAPPGWLPGQGPDGLRDAVPADGSSQFGLSDHLRGKLHRGTAGGRQALPQYSGVPGHPGPGWGWHGLAGRNVAELRFAAPTERRVAIVTGGARGIGRACALRLAEAGRDVVIADVLPQAADVVREVEALGQRALAVATDVTDEAAVHGMVRRAHDEFGRLDILVCSAGILGLEAPFLEQSAAQFDRVLRINLYGVYFCHQAALPFMLANGWGRCVS
ncbi:MAG: SDR family NAD(P)-dependent oxidoreductase, partial [SAR202 cluster bacterium]|nr:SDR family NAD(P)-dependent oxidoreductase [SAR202 cluster bacterium]